MLRIHKNLSVVASERDEPDAAVDPKDPLALLPWFRSPVSLEPGLTSAHLILALAPWANTLGKAGWLDMEAWVTGIRRSGPTRLPRDEPAGAEILLEPRAVIRQSGTGVGLTVRWHASGRYDTSHPAWSEDYGADFSPTPLTLSSWVNLPIRVETRMDVPPVRPRKGGTGVATVGAALKGEGAEVEPTFFAAIVLGFLDDISAYGSPE